MPEEALTVVRRFYDLARRGDGTWNLWIPRW